jgi:anti-sigma28 factor (negative regulator of flagellin synthesis)
MISAEAEGVIAGVPLDKRCFRRNLTHHYSDRSQLHFRLKLLCEVCHVKKSKHTAHWVVGGNDAVSHGDLIDEVLRLLLVNAADGVRSEKVTMIKSALANGTYNVNAEDLAGRIIRHVVP